MWVIAQVAHQKWANERIDGFFEQFALPLIFSQKKSDSLRIQMSEFPTLQRWSHTRDKLQKFSASARCIRKQVTFYQYIKSALTMHALVNDKLERLNTSVPKLLINEQMGESEFFSSYIWQGLLIRKTKSKHWTIPPYCPDLAQADYSILTIDKLYPDRQCISSSQ